MPPPAEPCIPSVAGLSAQEAADADPDYLYFLRHVRLDGDAYAVEMPSEDGASSPPQVIRYEQPLPDHNAGTPAAGSERGGQRAPPSAEENRPRATGDDPHGVKRKAPDASPGGEARSGAVSVEEDTATPVEEHASYDSQPDFDDDYLFFLRHAREVEGNLVFETGNCSITIGEGSVDHSDAEDDDDTEEEEEDEGEEEEEEEEGEDEEDDEVGNPEDGIGTEEKYDEDEAVPASVTEVKEEEESEEDDDYMGPESEIQIVNEPVYYETRKVEGGEQPLNAIARGTTDLDPLGKKEASSSRGHLAVPLNASELQGVIWPPHINDRPNSVFKEKLIECLSKPFTQEEYDKSFAMATDRSPLLKERRTRNKVAYYPWTHEMNPSYFDRYPDLAEQFSLQCNNYPNRLALLRGLFFWLQNIGQEDQFRPWNDDFKKYRVIVE